MRILIIEDDPVRERALKSWLPESVRAVVASSAGAAIGLIRRDAGATCAGVVLDHDLQLRRASDTDRQLSGRDVVDAIVASISKEVPILIHSVNASGAAAMAGLLDRAGFEVAAIPMSELLVAPERFQAWLEHVSEVWQDLREDRDDP